MSGGRGGRRGGETVVPDLAHYTSTIHVAVVSPGEYLHKNWRNLVGGREGGREREQSASGF